MNFTQVIQLTKETISEARTEVFLFELAISEFIKAISRANAPGWEEADLHPDDISGIFLSIRWELQMQGARMCGEDEEYNNIICQELTGLLEALRETLVKNFPVQLPKAVVVLPTTELVVAGGKFEEIRDEKGQKLIALRRNPFDLKIRIIKTPVGPAPEEFRKLWLNCQPLPAYRRPRQAGQERIIAHLLPPDSQQGVWIVPKKAAIDAMREVSAEAADWFLNYFGEEGDFMFRIDEAEISAATT